MRCNLCNSEKIRALYIFDSHILMKCENCDLIFTDQNSIKTPKRELYDEDYFIKRPFFEDCRKDYEERKSKKLENFKEGIKLIEKYSNKGKILDLGCATGFFLILHKRGGGKAMGLIFQNMPVIML